MAADYFLKLDTITGESTDKGHTGQIEIDSFSWGAENPTTVGSGTSGAGAGKVKFGTMNFSTAVSKASPALYSAMCTGSHLATGVLSVRKAGGTQLDYLTYSMAVIFVTSQQISSGANGAVIEHYSLAFGKMTESYMPQNADGSLGSAVVNGWDVTVNQKV